MAGSQSGSADEPGRKFGLIVVDGLARSYGWSRREILHGLPIAEALILLDLVGENQRGEHRFQAALHGVELKDDGRGGQSTGIKGFHEKIKQRWKR